MAVNYNGNIVTNGLVLCLDAANRRSYPGTGTSWTDLSGKANNGTLTNGPTFNSSNGGSIVLDGIDDYIVTYNNTGISGASKRSLCVWAYPTELTTDQFYSAAKIGDGNNGALFEILFYNNSITGHFFGGGFSFGVSADKTLLNNYTYVVMTYSGSVVSIYIDGVFKGSSNQILNTTNTQLYAGLKQFSSHANFKGREAIIKLYNIELTETEIKQNYKATRKRFGL